MPFIPSDYLEQYQLTVNLKSGSPAAGHFSRFIAPGSLSRSSSCSLSLLE